MDSNCLHSLRFGCQVRVYLEYFVPQGNINHLSNHPSNQNVINCASSRFFKFWLHYIAIADFGCILSASFIEIYGSSTLLNN